MMRERARPRFRRHGGRARDRGGRSLAAALLCLCPLVLSHPFAARAQVETDGTVGDAVDLPGPAYEIPGDLGTQRGSTLFHSFLRFGVPTGSSATFTADGLDPGAPVDLIVSRVTGGESSTIDGTIASTVGEQQFLFVNPSGVVFGANARVEVPGSFHVTTADQVEFADGSVYSAISPAMSTLSSAPVAAFGFLGADVPAPIEVRGALEVGRGSTISLVAGDIDIIGPGTESSANQGLLSAVEGSIGLVALAAPGRVTGVLGPVEGLAVDESIARGDIRVTDNATITASSLSPVFRPREPGDLVPPEQLAGPFLNRDGSLDRIARLRLNLTGLGEHDVFLGEDSAGTRFYLRPESRGDAGAGTIRIIGDDLTVSDSDISSQTAGDGAAGGISIDLDGDLVIERIARASDVGLISRSGIDIQGSQTVLSSADGLLRYEDVTLRIVGAGDAGRIEIDARSVRIEGGGRITGTSFGDGRGGDIDITATDEVRIAGRFDGDGDRSAIFSSGQGRGDAGNVTITDATRLAVVDGGTIVNQTTGNGSGGVITLDVGTLEVRNDGQIDSSTSGTGLRPEDGETTSGLGGRLDITASERVIIAGDSQGLTDTRISSFSGVQSSGAAGEISITTPELEISEGGQILATTRGEGAGGSVRLDIGALSMQRDGVVTTSSEASFADLAGRKPGAAGSIEVGVEGGTHRLGRATLSASQVSSEAIVGPAPPDDPAETEATREGNITFNVADRLELRDDARIEASVERQLGGSIRIGAPQGVILRDSSAIFAQAGSGQGGRIEITSQVLIEEAAPLRNINADAGEGVDGEVIITSPITQIEGQSPPLDTAFLDPSSLIRSACEAREAGEGGSLQVVSVVGLAPSSDYYLRASLTPTNAERVVAEDAFGAGRYVEAAEAFARAADAAGTPVDHVSALVGLADAQLALGHVDEAGATLGEAGALADAIEDAPEARETMLSLVANQRANVAFYQDDFASVATETARAIEHARSGRSSMLEAVARANALRAELEAGPQEAMPARLGVAVSLARAVDEPDLQARMAVHLATTASGMADRGVLERARADSIRLDALQAAWQVVRSDGDDRSRSIVLLALGELYTEPGDRSADAIALFEQALVEAEASGDSLLQASATSQRARLLDRDGDAEAALADWQRAVALLDAGRPESLPRYGRREAGLAEQSRPVYLGLADILLRQSGSEGGEADARLLEARATVERYRAVELRDYFEDACIAELAGRTRQLDELLDDSADRVAVVYPVVFDDRLELIVSSAGDVRRVVVDVDEPSLSKQVHLFRRLLERRTTRAYLRPAQQLHAWLIDPIAPVLGDRAIDTLIFVPGRLFREIPMAALHDGDSFLVERYALGLAPGLSLVDARPVELEPDKILLAGLSESREGFAPLPGVEKELDTIHESRGGQLLLNDAFDPSRFEAQLAANDPAVVHIASHAFFTGRLRSSFILSADGRIGFGELGRMLGRAQYAAQPVELLVLSACETSSGNERASLGLTGLAVRAGARSAMGSLWSISDDATLELITSFYRELGEPGVSKAEALRRAQRELIARPQFAHPYYWSPMLLVSNWM